MFKVLVSALLLVTAAISHAQTASWPQELTAGDGSVVVVYQPQIEEFTGNSLEARAAVSVRKPASGNVPVFGAVWITARIDTDRDTRMGTIRDIEITDVRFADATATDKEALAQFIEAELEASSLTISVDQLLADLDAETARVGEVALRHDPPKIILSTEPAILVSIDGEPVLKDLEGTKHKRVVNSAFLIVEDGRSYYLYVGSNAWYRAKAIAGPWAATQQVPSDIAGLVERAEPDGTDLGDLKIIVATEPTELVVSDGEPSWAPVEGMNLLYMDNTDSNVFLELSTQRYYVLLSGRWYRGEGLVDELVWTHVPNDELPEPFATIPERSVNGAVLSQVAGTPQARDALLENAIPQTAAIKRDDSSFNVQYDGEPSFAPIEEIPVEYAQNTTAAVFRYGNLYYACDDGVWYTANSATGPWRVATEVPDAIYKIPASNPYHNVTYVKVYEVTPRVVYVGYTPGYYGSYYYHGTVVYGTGWYYNPWYGPYYYPRYPTWGFHVTYNPWTGWGYGVSWTNGPFRFRFSTHGGWWGVGGYRPYPRPVLHSGYRKTNVNVTSGIGGGRDRPETRPNLYNRPENRQRNVESPALADSRPTRPARPAADTSNDVLTDRSGNVYQRDADGAWSERNNGQWTRPSNLDRAPAAPSTRPAPGTPPTAPATRPAPSKPPTAPSTRPAPSAPSTAPSVRPAPPTARPTPPSVQQRPSTGAGSAPPTQRPGNVGTLQRPVQSAPRPQLERDFQARRQGAQRAQSFQQQRNGERRR